MTFKPFIKWAGGKENELPVIIKNLPHTIDRFIEPFVGGGAVYFNINIKESVINDKSEELISLYRFIKEGNEIFFKYIDELYKCWKLLDSIVANHNAALNKLYVSYRKNKDKGKLRDSITSFVLKNANEFDSLFETHFNINLSNFIHEIQRNLTSKIQRMYKIENDRGKLDSSDDVIANIETAFKSAFYMHFRYLYNHRLKLNINNEFSLAMFYFIREYCYSSMFRYNSSGHFNVPYGGMSYNHKDFSKKIEHIKSTGLKKYMEHTKIYNMDFEELFRQLNVSERDFIFLDPPYDTEFSSYVNNEFNKEDQKCLADFLKGTQAKFMLIIKNTEFIRSLYSAEGLFISTFDKKYLVSFQNRNKKDTEHLLITNYKTSVNIYKAH